MSGISNGAYVLSNSELQTYKDCRRKWWLTYYRKLKPKAVKVTGPLALGSRVHEALDRYYTTNQPLLEAYKDLMAVDRQFAVDNWLDIPALDSEGEMGRIMLEGYLDWVTSEGIDANLEMISTEEIISMPMFNGEVELQGKLDMRVRRKADNVRLFRDFKTTQNFGDITETAQINEQILTYMLLESQQVKEDERCDGGIFTMLRKVKRSATAKPPFYSQFEVRHNIFTMRSFWDRIHGTVGDLMRTKTALDAGASPNLVAYPRPSRDCTWKCPFFAVCPMFDDGSAVEDAIDNQFVVGDPYDYYAPSEKKGSE